MNEMDIKCPFCGSSVGAWSDVTYDYVSTVTIECEGRECRAEWDSAGKMVTNPDGTKVD